MYLYCATCSLLVFSLFSLQLTHHNKLLHQLNLTEDQQIIVKTTTIGGYSAAVRGARVKFNMYLSLSFPPLSLSFSLFLRQLITLKD